MVHVVLPVQLISPPSLPVYRYKSTCLRVHLFDWHAKQGIHPPSVRLTSLTTSVGIYTPRQCLLGDTFASALEALC